MSLLDIESRKLKRQQTYIRCQKLSKMYMGVDLDFLISAAISVLKSIFMIKQTCQLIKFIPQSDDFFDFSTIFLHYTILLIVLLQFKFAVIKLKVVYKFCPIF